MPSLGPAEILVILVIALLVFGPNKLPDVAKQAGKAFQELRRVQQHLRSEISGAMSDLDGSSQSASAPSGDPVPMLPALDPDAAPSSDSVMPPPAQSTPPSQSTPPAATPPAATPSATDPLPPSSPPPADPA
ncbi:MAG: twin-arginine translocase TatA/TatE family subunit [Acidimicrobiia bacterium]